MIDRFLRQTLLPRVVYIPWALSWLWLTLLAAIQYLASIHRRPQRSDDPVCICIEAGERGWESIEFKELYQSACEYVGPDRVLRFVVKRDVDYLEQLASLLRTHRVSHYLYDPRTGSQHWWHGLWQSLRVATLLQCRNVTPIVLLTDLSIRIWRAQASVVTARKGLVVSFMSPRVVHPIFPHSRLIGPCLMPFSMQTRDSLDSLISSRQGNTIPQAIFTGSLYEPRTSILKDIESGVKARGGNFECLGRIVGTTRVADEKYWRRLVNADIVFTTSVQMIHSGTDWAHIPHLIYRYLEVIASGSLLVAQEVPAVRRFFTPGVHYVAYTNSQDAIDKIIFYLKNNREREAIAMQGKKRADSLLNSRFFWLSIDASLGRRSIF